MVDWKHSNFIFKIKEIKYEFEEEIVQNYDPTKSEELTFKCDGNFNLFQKVYINDKELERKYYTVKEGSTIITVNKDYLSSLEDGSYTLKVEYSNGKVASTKFTVGVKEENKVEASKNENSNEEVPKTGDNVLVYLFLLIISIAGILKVSKVIKSKI